MRRAALLLILPVILCAQTAQFPGAVAADKNLTVQKDRAQSTLTGSMTASATSATVVTGSKFIAGQIVSVDNEQMLVCSVVGNTLNFGYSSCPNVDGRGYAGTSAASHANSALISGNIVAWNHNAMAAEIKAIETALGSGLSAIDALIAAAIATIPSVPDPLPVNKGGTNATTASGARTNLGAAASGANSDITSLSALSTPLSVPQGGTGAATNTGILQGNGTSAQTAVAAASEGQYLRRRRNAGATTVYEFANPANYPTSDYNFTAQTPGGSLSVGSNTITLAPCPVGVNGSDSNHYLRVSGGVGTAESVLITGGTCTSGATTGTVIITAANTHSGAWTIASASGGIVEAGTYLVGASKSGTILVDQGITVYQKIQFPNTGTAVALEVKGAGAGGGQITRDSSYANGDLFYVTSGNIYPSVIFRDLDVACAPFNAAFVSTAGAGFHFFNYGYEPATVENVRMMNCYQGVLIEGSSLVTVEGGYIGWHTPVVDATTPRAGIEVKRSAGNLPQKVHLRGVDIQGTYSASRPNVQFGILVTSSDGLDITGGNLWQVATGLSINGDAFFVTATNLTVDYTEAPIVLDASSGSLMGPISISNNWIGGVTATASPGPTAAMVAAVDISATSGTAGASVKFTLNNNTIQGGGIYGIRVLGANVTSGTIASNSIIGNNSRNQAGGAGIALGQGASNISIVGNSVRDVGSSSGYQHYGLLLADPNSSNLTIRGNSFGGNLTGPMIFNATPLTSDIGGNAGVDSVVSQTIASAATVTVGIYPFYTVTGTTAIATINGGWIGRVITLQFTNAAPGGVTTGGNIYTAKTAAQNATVSLKWDGTKWMVL